MFVKGSRYEKVGDAQYIDLQGHVFGYKKIRFIPETPARFNHLVIQGERLDLLSFRYYHDPLKFWHIADASISMQAEELTSQPGTRILIPPDTQ
jgi:hypothetical protein